MANKEEGKKIDKKTVIIVILAVICMLLISFIIFLVFGTKSISGSSSFLQSTYALQDKVSNYMGKSSAETFGVYTNEEIITGKTSKNNEQIKDNEDKEITPLVNLDEKVEENGKVAYKINSDNLKKELNTSMPTFDGIDYYIQDGITIKVKLQTKPEWWNEDLDFLLVGRD